MSITRSSSASTEGDWSTPGLSDKWTVIDQAKPKFADKEKLGRGRFSDLKTFAGGILRKFKLRLALAFIVLIVFLVFAPLQLTSPKFVIVVGSNQGGGVMEWKGAKEWAIERDSLKNKVNYAKRWGYDLEVVDMMTKKRYAHEWRESWEKVDVLKKTMRKYPKAEWFWWLDLHTFIMEPSYSLDRHIFNDLNKNTYRDINVYNPLNISHPLTWPHLKASERSPNGDGKANSINLIIPQDCAGFNLGSFFIRRGEWTERLLDLWWDPVFYEQRHMQWEHKEQDALEYLYSSHPWIRSRTAFIEQRKINSFPPGACADTPNDQHIHYQASNRDFVVNMAGCQWGRDCWNEMLSYRELSRTLNKGRIEKVREWVSASWKGQKATPPHSLDAKALQILQLEQAAKEHGIHQGFS